MSDEVFEYKDQLAYVPESRILEILKENRDTIGSIRSVQFDLKGVLYHG